MKSYIYINYVPVADIICELHFQNKEHKEYFENRWYCIRKPPKKYKSVKIYLGESIDSYLLSSKPKRIGITVSKQKLASFNDILVLIKLLIEYNCVSKKILFFHGSSLTSNGKGYAFCAPSGTGKSTIVSQMPKRDILSDDLVVIKKSGNKFHLYTSPFDELMKNSFLLKNAPLDTIFFLKQSKQTKIENLTIEKGLYNLIVNNLVMGWNIIQAQKKRITNKSLDKSIHSLLLDLANSCNLKTLFFAKDSSFLDIISK